MPRAGPRCEVRFPTIRFAWEAEYQARIGRILDLVQRPGRTIVWIGMPVATASNI